MKKVLPKVKRIINMSLKQAKFYGDDVVRIEHIVISLINLFFYINIIIFVSKLIIILWKVNTIYI